MSQLPVRPVVSPPPHFTTAQDVKAIMYAVIYALLPAAFGAVYFFGWQALSLMVTCVVAAVLTEYIIQKLRKKPVTALDGSAIITGILLAFTLPPAFPFYLAIIGSVVAVGIGKQVFGGLGFNIFNPALVGRAFLQAAFPVEMAKWSQPLAWLSGKVEAVAGATPLGLAKFESKITPYLKLFLGNTSGSLGETSALLLLIGAVYLLYKDIIDWRLPMSMIGSVALFTTFLWLINPQRYPDPLFSMLAGGLILGAFYMATDYVTTPVTPSGRWLFGLAAGVLVVIIRVWGGLPEGVMYAILLMNAFTPLINRFTRPKPFGYS